MAVSIKTRESDANIEKTQNEIILLLAQKLYIVLGSTPNSSRIVTFSSVVRFLKYITEYLSMSIEEDIIMIAVMEIFMQKQALKGIKVLSTNNVGTLLIVLAMITIKMYRDHGYRNNHIANMFKIELSALNKSEAAFLRIIDYSLLVSDEVFSHLFEEIFSFKYRKFLL